MREPLIEVRNLTIGWGSVRLLENVSFTVQQGEVFVILGGSGSGKSTLLRHMIGLEEPRSGEVLVHAEACNAQGYPGAPTFGVMFQSGALLGSITVGENVGLPLAEWTNLPPEAIDVIVGAKLRLVGLEGTAPRMPSELSGGMRKRAAIARALALDSRLLFLDEPSAGLDPITSAELDALIRTLNEGLGVTVVMVTHELESLLAIGTRCIFIDRVEKGIIAEGDPRVLRNTHEHPQVKAFFHRQAMHGTAQTGDA
jgi:phospholipid/cholesterol/gamma-HCH transport system ATP-binding protein